MKEIELSNRLICKIDDDDYDKLSKYNWHCKKYKSKNKITIYAAAWTRCNDDKKRWVFMHRFVLGLKHNDAIIVDHKDDDTLNNQKNNLRKCTIQQNNISRDIKRDNKQSKYKGVCRTRNGKRWRATISLNDKFIYIGTFDAEEEAAIAYNNKARDFYGEYARLNEVIIND